MDRLHLDCNATYGLLPEVRDALFGTQLSYFNPSSIHSGGQRARAAIEQSRREVASLAGLGEHDELVFTSGATEANNSALRALIEGAPPRGDDAPEVVLTAIEHPSVRETARHLSRRGYGVREIRPAVDGTFRDADLVENLGAETRLVAIMAANNETGQILPLERLVPLCRAHAPNALVHVDFTQALGKTELGFDAVGADTASISAHKIGGLPGTGALLVREGIELPPLLHGGPQELRRRAGTENTLGIVSFGLAAKAWARNGAEWRERMRSIRDLLERRLRERVAGCTVHVASQPRIPNTTSVAIGGVRTDDLVVAADLHGVLISAGAACASGKPLGSEVLESYGLPEEMRAETVRLSGHAALEARDVDRAVDVLARCAAALRGMSERARQEA